MFDRYVFGVQSYLITWKVFGSLWINMGNMKKQLLIVINLSGKNDVVKELATKSQDRGEKL